MPTRLTIRFDFDGERRLGPGKIALLEAIAQTGSISAAGAKVVALYRAAERKMRVGAKAEIARMERALAASG